jgi:hypothetical protein
MIAEDGARSAEWDFFLSYTQADRAWAEWIAWQLEEDGYRVLIQAWEAIPGRNWVESMRRGIQHAARTIAVLSPEYLSSVFATEEWLAAWRADPLDVRRKLVPLRVRECERPGILGSVVTLDLFGMPDEGAARECLLGMVGMVSSGRAKPRLPLPFRAEDYMRKECPNPRIRMAEHRLMQIC